MTPVWWDQTFAADRIAALGVGKRGPHFAKVTGENLAALIGEVTTFPSYSEKAASIAKVIAAEPAADDVIATRVHNGIMQLRPTAKVQDDLPLRLRPTENVEDSQSRTSGGRGACIKKCAIM